MKKITAKELYNAIRRAGFKVGQSITDAERVFLYDEDCLFPPNANIVREKNIK